MRRVEIAAFEVCSSTDELTSVSPGLQGSTSTSLWWMSGAWGGKPAPSESAATANCSAVWGRRPVSSLLATWSQSIFLAVLVLAFSVAGFAAPRKLAADLQSVSTGDVDVIVQFKVRPTADQFSKVQSLGGKLKHDLRGTLKGASFHVPASALSALEQMDDVAHISLDHTVNATGAARDFYVTAENAPAPGAGHDGTGIGVAIIDSGISGNGDLPSSGPGARVVYSESFVPGDSSTSDAYGHGTHVAGIVGGNGHNSSGPGYTYTFKGIAPNVNLINLRVLDANGSATDSSVIAAIQRAISLKSQYNIRVINLSIGRPVYESYTVDPLCQAVEAAWQSGIVVVAAAGNMGRYADTNGYATITAPGTILTSSPLAR